jgi:hypothetical protein
MHDKNVSNRALDVVHSNVWGPTKTTSMGGCRYYVSFIDDHTRKVWVYFMKEKSEVFTHFQNFRILVEKQTRLQVKCQRSDGGGEYFSNEFTTYLKMHGIQRQFTCRYIPQQNGVAERKNMHIAEVARALMAYKNMPHHYWAEVVATPVYIMNRTPTSVVHGMTLEEKYSGKKPDLSHFKVFGCIAYVHVLDKLRIKLDPKAGKCVFIGYSLEQKGYICYNHVTHEMRVSRDVFNEMSSQYVNVKDSIGVDAHEHVVAKNAGQQSHTLNGPQESHSSGSTNRPWSGRLRHNSNPTNTSDASYKGKEKVGEPLGMPDISTRYSHVDGESSGSEQSLDEEFGIPAIKTPGVRKANVANRIPRTDPGPRRSTRERRLVQRLIYDGYVAHHYAYMAKVV